MLKELKFKRATIVVVWGCILFGLTQAIQERELPLENYCPYFKNRAPKPQPHLQNCTWYRENACCLPNELNIILENIPPPLGANKKCLKMLNYLMCYVCAPNQDIFYQEERLTVCLGFCNRLFDACGEAYLKGSKIRDFYLSGTDFCISRKFKVGNGDSDDCFNPDKGAENSSSIQSVTVWPWVVGCVTAVMHYTLF